MKIGIVTYHKACSYGACLQAYATFRVLSKLGHDVEMIDYTNPYEQRIKKISFSSNGSLKSVIINTIKSIVFKRHKLLKKAFGSFVSNYKLSTKEFTSIDEMKELEYDILVVGSDQVWNPEVTNGVDSVFLLEFGKAKKKISISSSFGSYHLRDYEKERFKNALKDFSSISVREEFAAKQLNELGFDNIQINCDPTMLLVRDEWEDFIKPSNENGYILTFFVSSTFNSFYKKVECIKNRIDAPIWNVQSSAFKWKGVDKIIVGATPEEFLGLVKNAKYVITDSFHGAVFSILFHKQFTVISNSANPIRTNELLNSLHLNCCKYDVSLGEITEEKYRDVDFRIQEMRRETMEWLVKCIN